MHERVPLSGLGAELRARPFGILAVTSVALLCVLVTVVGAFAIIARAVGTWQSLFYMEQAFALTVPTVKALMVVSLAASFAAIWRR